MGICGIWTGGPEASEEALPGPMPKMGGSRLFLVSFVVFPANCFASKFPNRLFRFFLRNRRAFVPSFCDRLQTASIGHLGTFSGLLVVFACFWEGGGAVVGRFFRFFLF